MNGSFKLRFMAIVLFTGMGAAFAGQAPQSQPQDDAGVRDAIRFERAKDAAAARQARIEAGRVNQSSVKQQSQQAKNAAGDRQAHGKAVEAQVAASSRKRR